MLTLLPHDGKYKYHKEEQRSSTNASEMGGSEVKAQKTKYLSIMQDKITI
jgi:hypothetical protein